MRIGKLFIGVWMLLMLVGLSVAEQQGNLPVDYFRSEFDQLRVINGGLCTDLPDDAGTVKWYGFEVFCTGATGVTSDMTGCVVHWRTSDRKLFKEDIIKPGEKAIAPANAAFWERYNCHDVDYVCTDYQSEGCGKSGSYADCAENEMLRVRECGDNTPSSVETERCIAMYECIYQHCNVVVPDWGPCEDGLQQRTIIEADCSRWVDSQPCSVDCSSPYGHVGDTDCRDGKLYVCNYDGNWKTMGICSDGGDSGSSGTSCNSPAGSVGDKICYQGFDRTCTSSGTWKTGDACTVAEDLEATSVVAFYDPDRQAVIGRVGIKNNGPDMVDTHILEMQVVPAGEDPLAVVGAQTMCDPNHPENVHRQFRINSGEEAVIELMVPAEVLEEGPYDVHFLSRHKCYKDLTQEQRERHDDYQRVPPFPTSEKVSDIVVGDAEGLAPKNMWAWIGGVMILIGVILTLFQVYMFGLPVAAVGALIIIIQALVHALM